MSSLRRTAGWVVLLCLLGTGCSYQAWYEGARDSRRQECYRLPPGEVQDCLDRVNRADYEKYRRERLEVQDEESSAEH